MLSSNWLNIDKQQSCICWKTYQKTDPSMIQCENCLEWYHFPCIIRDKKSFECITTTSSENITFLCGECDKKQCCMIVDNDGEITDF